MFFKVVPVAEAQSVLLQALSREANAPQRWVQAGHEEEVPLVQAVGRVLAHDIVAGEDLPPFARSTVDGYAVRAEETFGAGESLPAYLQLAGEVAMGRPAPDPWQEGQCFAIPTGGILPEGCDAVVMLEHTELPGDGTVAVMRPVAPGENLIQRGEDARAGEVVLKQGRLLRAPDIGVAAALGYAALAVRPRPRVAVLSTGDELVPPGASPAQGQIRDVNSFTLAAAVRTEAAEPQLLGIVPDRIDALREALGRAMTADAVLISGGSSVGARDLVAGAIAELGEPGILLHGVAVRPGKPVIVAIAGGKPVFGLPGHPVSASVMFHLLVRPALRFLAGMDPFPPEPVVRARLSRSLASRSGVEELVRVSVESDGAERVARPVLGKSGLINTLARAWGLVRIPAESTGLAEGDQVEVIPIYPI